MMCQFQTQFESLCKIISILAKSRESLSNFLVHSVTPLGQRGLLKSTSLFCVGDMGNTVKSRALGLTAFRSEMYHK